MGRRWALAVLGALVALGATAAAASGAALVAVSGAQFASDPIYATGPPGDGRLFVVERAGRIDVVEGGPPKPFLTVPDVANQTKEQATAKLKTAGFTPVIVQVDSTLRSTP